MMTLRYLGSRIYIYGEAVWAFFHPLKIMESEIEANRLFHRIKVAGLEQRIQALEKRQ